MSLTEEQASRLVQKRPQCSAAESYFGIANTDAELLWSLVEATAGRSERNVSFVNDWGSVLRNRGLRGDVLLEQLADLVVNNLYR
jgi:hypothetical protein